MKLVINFLGTWQRRAIDSGAVAETEARVLNYKSADGTEQGLARRRLMFFVEQGDEERGGIESLSGRNPTDSVCSENSVYMLMNPLPLLTFR